MLIIQFLLLSIPILFMKDIKHEAIRFSMALLVIILFGNLFYKIMEGYFKSSLENVSNDKYKWVGVIVQVFILIMFYTYSKRLLEVLS